MTENDRALARSSQQLPDGRQLGALLDQIQPRLFAVALRITRDPEAARDVVQAAFEKVVRHHSRFRGDSRVSTWVHRIVANEALIGLRTARRRHETPEPITREIRDKAPSALDRLLARERRMLLWEALTGLSARDRDVMERCGLAGWTYAEYSAQTGIPVAAVKSRAFRARHRLKARLGTGVSRGA